MTHTHSSLKENGFQSSTLGKVRIILRTSFHGHLPSTARSIICVISSSKKGGPPMYSMLAQAKAPAPNPDEGAYGSPDPSYGAVAHGSGYADAYGRPQVQMNGGVSADGIYPYGASSGVAGNGVAPSSEGVVVGSSHPDVCGRQQVQVSVGSTGDAMNSYGGNIAAAVSGYVESYGRPQVRSSGAIGEGMNPYGAAGASIVPGSGGWGGPYICARDPTSCSKVKGQRTSLDAVSEHPSHQKQCYDFE